MIKKVNLFLQTAKYLKLKQLIHQVKYRLIKPDALTAYGGKGIVIPSPLIFSKTPPISECWHGNGRFTFLNLEVDFENSINWNFQQHGKLWNYNLQYANYLLQPNPSDNKKERLITDLYQWLSDGRLPLEPYPVSLRSINMIRWLSTANVSNLQLVKNLYAELSFLSKRLEYHLLGNHLLENAFALLMGGGFFSNANWIATGKKILKAELIEQILEDGGHFELSPMYHQIIFFRLLELIDWYSKWEGKEPQFESFLRLKASKMRTWLEQITFKNGDIPHFNDSANGVAYSTEWLITYAGSLSVRATELKLGESGYRSVNHGDYECRIDVAQIGPNYQPGHAHADALSFILYYQGKPLFVEQGTSTYQIGKIREKERSTAAHNTVVVATRNQSNVWGGFRVAERATVAIVEDQPNRISAQQNGYRKLGVTHKRTFEFGTDIIKIVDEVQGNDKCPKEFHLHFYPELEINVDNNAIEISNGVAITFESSEGIQIQKYIMANGYNRYKTGKKIVIPFENILTTNILIKGRNP